MKVNLQIEKSKAAFVQARRVLVGGVNSPVRAFAAVGGAPVFIASAKGAHLTDIDGSTYVDYVGSYGPTILGHIHEAVISTIGQTIHRGTSFGAPTEIETRLAEMIVEAVESIENVRFVNSGTEAVMSAVRLARGVTGRSKIVKCVGCYHGHADALLVSAGSGATTLGVPSSPGVPAGATADTLLVAYNDLSAMAEVVDDNVAAVLIEPVAGNMGVVPPAAGYLQGLRDLCDQHGVLLIFDEVMTGFRLAYGGAQALFGVCPDITTLGKIIGGGMPVGAVGAPEKIMKHLAPEGPVYQAGTLSGNPVAMAAGLATLQQLQQEGFYARLEKRSAELARRMKQASMDAGLDDRVSFNRVGSMLSCFFTKGPVDDYSSATRSHMEAFAAYFHAMLKAGIFLAPSQFEAMFVSAAHDDDDIEKTFQAATGAFQAAGRVLDKQPEE
jgi:glutamate-1-semialdehyde 2,1-aminomutase